MANIKVRSYTTELKKEALTLVTGLEDWRRLDVLSHRNYIHVELYLYRLKTVSGTG